jgi:hypothetical protein
MKKTVIILQVSLKVMKEVWRVLKIKGGKKRGGKFKEKGEISMVI